MGQGFASTHTAEEGASVNGVVVLCFGDLSYFGLVGYPCGFCAGLAGLAKLG